MSEDPEFAGTPASGNNRTFALLVVLLLLPLLLIAGIGAAFILPRLGQTGNGGNPQGTATAVAGVQGTAIAEQLLTQRALSPTPKPTNSATVRPSATRVIVASSTVPPSAVTNTPPVNRDTPTSAAAGASPTRIGGVAPTPTRVGGGSIPPGGLASELGGPMIVLAGLGLLAIVFVARRLRSG